MTNIYDGSKYDEGLVIEYKVEGDWLEIVSPIFQQLNPVVQDSIVDDIFKAAS